jgi:hypothetical protein
MKIVLVASTKLPNNSETRLKDPPFVIGLFFHCTLTLDAEKISQNCACGVGQCGFFNVKTPPHIHVAVSDLYIPTIVLQSTFSCSRIGRPIVGIYESLTVT